MYEKIDIYIYDISRNIKFVYADVISVEIKMETDVPHV